MGKIDGIGISGKAWTGRAVDISDMLFGELESANESIQISSFSTGHQSSIMERFFHIIRGRLQNPLMKISVIINDDGAKSITPYARKQISLLENDFPKQFFPLFFKQRRDSLKILHAKITVIDGKTALIGSANLSKSAMESNYEIMLKVTGDAAIEISKLLSHLSTEIRSGRA